MVYFCLSPQSRSLRLMTNYMRCHFGQVTGRHFVHWETLGDILVYWETFWFTGKHFVRWETLGDISVYWETLPCTGGHFCVLGDTGRHFCVLGDILVHWETLGDTGRHFSVLGDISCTGRHFGVLGDTGRHFSILGHAVAYKCLQLPANRNYAQHLRKLYDIYDHTFTTRYRFPATSVLVFTNTGPNLLLLFFFSFFYCCSLF